MVLSAALSVNSYAQKQVTVKLDSTRQIIRGFGAANIVGWRKDMTDSEIQTAFGTGEGELGFTILRLKIHPDPSQWVKSVSTAKKAHQMGAKIIASPWNAPDDMLDPNAQGDTVLYSKYDEYAAHLDSFNTYMSEQGVPIYAISVQNEPDYANDWTGWSPEGMLKFMRENAPSIGTRVMAPESFQFRRDMSDPLLNDSVAASNLDIVAGHIYGGGLGPYPLAREKGKELWMTEHLTASDQSANNWSLALDVANEMQQTMKSGMSAYVWWYIVRYYGPISDGEFSDGARKGEVTKKGYVMAQYAKFIRPGFKRLHVKDQFERGYLRVTSTAYKDTSKVVIVAINAENSPKDVQYTFENGTVDKLHRYVTSSSQNVEPMEDVMVSNNQFTATLGAESVTTFVSDNLTVANEELPSTPRAIRLKQNYPNPFNPATNIQFDLPKASTVRLEVFNMLGQKVRTLVNGHLRAGSHKVSFDAQNLSSGIYLYRLTAGNTVRTKKMMLLK